MVAGLFHRRGYFMGPRLYPPREANPKGFFESPEVTVLNEDLLRTVGRKLWRSPRAWFEHRRLRRGQLWLTTLPLGVRLPAPSGAQAERIAKLVLKRPFAFKDPRFCHTLGVWKPWLEDCVFVCVFREPDRTAHSIVKECAEAPYLRGVRMTFDRALAVWQNMYEWVISVHAAGHDWVFVHYDQILNGSGIRTLEQVTGVGLDSSFPEQTLKRSPRGGRLPSHVSQLYQELCTRAGWAPES